MLAGRGETPIKKPQKPIQPSTQLQRDQAQCGGVMLYDAT